MEKEHSIQRKLDSRAKVVLPNDCFLTTPSLTRRISVTMGAQCFDVTPFQTSKLKKINFWQLFSLLGPQDYAVTKCCLNAISSKCWIPTPTLLETHTWIHTDNVYTHTRTHKNTHIYSHSLLYPHFQQRFRLQESVSGNKCFLDGSHIDTIEQMK